MTVLLHNSLYFRGLAAASSNQMMPTNPAAAVFHEYNNCAQHRGLVLGMVAAIQTVTLRCHSALVWNNLGDGKNPSFLCGSPLDYLPCPPSCLPMPIGPQNQQVRHMFLKCVSSLSKLRGRVLGPIKTALSKRPYRVLGSPFCLSDSIHGAFILHTLL